MLCANIAIILYGYIWRNLIFNEFCAIQNFACKKQCEKFRFKQVPPATIASVYLLSYIETLDRLTDQIIMIWDKLNLVIYIFIPTIFGL